MTTLFLAGLSIFFAQDTAVYGREDLVAVPIAVKTIVVVDGDRERDLRVLFSSPGWTVAQLPPGIAATAQVIVVDRENRRWAPKVPQSFRSGGPPPGVKITETDRSFKVRNGGGTSLVAMVVVTDEPKGTRNRYPAVVMIRPPGGERDLEKRPGCVLWVIDKSGSLVETKPQAARGEPQAAEKGLLEGVNWLHNGVFGFQGLKVTLKGIFGFDMDLEIDEEMVQGVATFGGDPPDQKFVQILRREKGRYNLFGVRLGVDLGIFDVSIAVLAGSGKENGTLLTAFESDPSNFRSQKAKVDVTVNIGVEGDLFLRAFTYHTADFDLSFGPSFQFLWFRTEIDAIDAKPEPVPGGPPGSVVDKTAQLEGEGDNIVTASFGLRAEFLYRVSESIQIGLEVDPRFAFGSDADGFVLQAGIEVRFLF